MKRRTFLSLSTASLLTSVGYATMSNPGNRHLAQAATARVGQLEIVTQFQSFAPSNATISRDALLRGYECSDPLSPADSPFPNWAV
jgi:hypothetical protein